MYIQKRDLNQGRKTCTYFYRLCIFDKDLRKSTEYNSHAWSMLKYVLALNIDF